MAIGNVYKHILHTMRNKFVIIICLRIFGSVKRGDRTLMGRSRPNFSPKLEPKHLTIKLEKGFQKKPIVAFTNSTVFIQDFNI